MALPQESKDKIYTYADYASWDLAEGERFELIDGRAYAMAAPSIEHQRISSALVGQLYSSLKGSDCEVFHAPFDVCLFGMGDQDRTVVQPDISVVCKKDKNKLEDGKRCNGAPEFVVEILSPSSASHDWFVKLNKYLQAGVREYWIVDPETKKVYVHLHDGNKFTYDKTDTITVTVVDNCVIDLNEVFN